MSLSALPTGALASRAMFAFRGGAFGDEREFAMTALLVRHPRGDLLIDTGFGRDVDAHVATTPRIGQALTRYHEGVPAAVHAAADARLTIPMRAGMRSLNVAVAAAMAAGEMLRQMNVPTGQQTPPRQA